MEVWRAKQIARLEILKLVGGVSGTNEEAMSLQVNVNLLCEANSS